MGLGKMKVALTMLDELFDRQVAVHNVGRCEDGYLWLIVEHPDIPGSNSQHPREVTCLVHSKRFTFMPVPLAPEKPK